MRETYLWSACPVSFFESFFLLFFFLSTFSRFFAPESLFDFSSLPSDESADFPVDFPVDFPEDSPVDFSEDSPEDFPEDSPVDFPEDSFVAFSAECCLLDLELWSFAERFLHFCGDSGFSPTVGSKPSSSVFLPLCLLLFFFLSFL